MDQIVKLTRYPINNSPTSTKPSEEYKSEDETKSAEEILYEKYRNQISYDKEDVLATLREFKDDPMSGKELTKLVMRYRQRKCKELADDLSQSGCWG